MISSWFGEKWLAAPATWIKSIPFYKKINFCKILQKSHLSTLFLQYFLKKLQRRHAGPQKGPNFGAEQNCSNALYVHSKNTTRNPAEDEQKHEKKDKKSSKKSKKSKKSDKQNSTPEDTAKAAKRAEMEKKRQAMMENANEYQTNRERKAADNKLKQEAVDALDKGVDGQRKGASFLGDVKMAMAGGQSMEQRIRSRKGMQQRRDVDFDKNQWKGWVNSWLEFMVYV